MNTAWFRFRTPMMQPKSLLDDLDENELVDQNPPNSCAEIVTSVLVLRKMFCHLTTVGIKIQVQKIGWIRASPVERNKADETKENNIARPSSPAMAAT